MSDELTPDLHGEVQRHCASGDKLADAQNFKGAITEYNKAWVLLPEPKDRWEAATWILAAIGDAAFLGGDIAFATQVFDDVLLCPGALGNAFIHLRRGQLLFDAGNLDGAADELMRAYMGGGAEAFAHESSKYLEFLGTRAAL